MSKVLDPQFGVNTPEQNQAPVSPNTSAKYQINYLTYPTDLLDPSLQFPNYVIFYINVPEESKMFKDEKSTDGMDNATINIDSSLRELGQLRGKPIKGGLEIGTILEGALGGGVASAVLNSNTVGSRLSTIESGIAGAGVADLAFKSLATRAAQFQRPTKRLQTAIALHIPNNLAISYGVNYEDQEMGLMGNIAALAASNPEIASKLESALAHFGLSAVADSNALKEIYQDVTTGGKASQGTSALISSTLIKNSAALGFASGLAANPRREQLFQSVNFRKFTMEYQFSARSLTEAQSILNIIYLFKYHMHPEFLDESNFLFVYPSEFDIVFYRGTSENLALHRHTSCVLTGLDVNYTPNGMFSLLNNGVPMQINVNMQFTELALLTKQKIAAMENPTQRSANAGFNESNRPTEI